MVQSALEAVRDQPIDVFVVWIPAIGGDRFEATERSKAFIPDERARHYWDGSQALGEALSPALGIRAKMAWDVYLVFDEDARWESSPPAPLGWMHQLGGEDPALTLDEAKLVELLNDALE